jgi:probable HAF family extracellular repeat protein
VSNKAFNGLHHAKIHMNSKRIIGLNARDRSINKAKEFSVKYLSLPFYVCLGLHCAVLADMSWNFMPLPNASLNTPAESWATGINNEGVVAGYVVDTSGSHLYLWNNVQPQNFGPVSLQGVSFPSINDLNEVSGYWTQETNSNGFFVTSTAGYVFANNSTILLQNNGNATFWPMAINNFGIVAGMLPNNGDAATYNTADGTLTDYGQFNAESAHFTAINNTGLIAGTLNYAVQPNEAAFVLYNGQLQALVGLAGPNTYPAAINDPGIIVGTATDPLGRQKAVTWTETGPSIILNSQHQLQAALTPILPSTLPLLPEATGSGANAINAAGDIVGWMLIGSDPGDVAVLWADGQVIDLNTLLPADSGWTLNDATGINDLGQIVGDGTYDGQEEAFLLTPTGAISIPEPGGISLVAGLCLLVIRPRRK